MKDRDLQELVRLCGLSLLYLPAEYAAGSLAIPTCFRATAQYLVQYGTCSCMYSYVIPAKKLIGSCARGIFRIPGSHTVVTALYNHYCCIDDGGLVAGTVRYPNLPEHIKYDVHDVASVFKRFLSGLPGGILGSLPLFETFVSIQSQLSGDPELTRTKQSKVRARLIALAVATLRSQYRRELICGVIGLLCMVGRAAETTRREDETGRPLPTSDLMGYGSLGVIFGPLLVGDMLDHCNYVRLASPQRGLVVLPVGSPKSRKEKHKKSKSAGDGVSLQVHIDKINLANGVMEMLITHWRDVVRHMKDLEALKTIGGNKSLALRGPESVILRPSASESFMMRKPPDWDLEDQSTRPMIRDSSPTPKSRNYPHYQYHEHKVSDISLSGHDFPLKLQENSHISEYGLQVKKQRSRTKPLSSHKPSDTTSMSVLSPTAEETFHGDEVQHKSVIVHEASVAKSFVTPFENEKLSIIYTIAPTSAKSHQYRRDSPSVPHFLPLVVSKRFRDGNDSSPVPSGSTNPVKRPSHDNKISSESVPEHFAGDHIGVNENAPEITQLIRDAHVRKLQQVALSSPQVHLPDTMVIQQASSSTKVSVSAMEGIVSSRVRQIAGSEPGRGPLSALPSPNRRYKSRTLGSPRGQKHVSDNTKGDPLNCVSHDDDIASLAKLAQALESLDESERAESTPGVAGAHHSRKRKNDVQAFQASSGAAPRSEQDAVTNERVSIVSTDIKKTAGLHEQEDEKSKKPYSPTENSQGIEDATDSTRRRFFARRSWLENKSRQKYNAAYAQQPHEFEYHEKKIANSAEQLDVMPPLRKRTDGTNSHQKSAQSPSRLPKSVTSPASNPFPELGPSVTKDKKPQLGRRSTDRSSLTPNSTMSKARSDVVGSASSLIIPRPCDGKVVAMSRGSSVKALAAKFDTASSESLTPTRPLQLETPKQNLLATYTHNASPSPSKSQNSMKSANSAKSFNTLRKPTQAGRTLIAQLKSSQIKVSPPRRFLRSSLEDITPLQSVTKSYTQTGNTLSTSSTRSSDSNPVALKLTSPLQAPRNLANFGSPSRFFDVDKRSTWIEKSQEKEHSEEDVHGQSRSLFTMSKTQTPFAETEIYTPLENALTLREFVGSQSSSTDNNFIRRLNSPPSSSVRQTLILQQQLSRKAEDLVSLIEKLDNRINPAIADLEQLKQQLANQADATVEVLTKQLKQANLELELWKNRAEVAEKRVEELENAPSNDRRRNIWRSSSVPVESSSNLILVSGETSDVNDTSCSPSTFGQQTHRHTGVSEDRAVVSGRIRRAPQSLDDANIENYEGISGDSNSTILRPRTPKVACGSFGYDDHELPSVKALHNTDSGSEPGEIVSLERIPVVVVHGTVEVPNDMPSGPSENHMASTTAVVIEGHDSWSQTALALNPGELCELE